MRRTTFSLLAVLGLCLCGIAHGHFHTFWPDSPNGYGRLGEAITWQYFWGHPYEMILFDAQEPVCYVATPNGERLGIPPTPAEMEDPLTGEMRRAFTFSHTPESIGDSWLVLEPPPYPIEEEGEALQDYVKQCIHVMAEVGWDAELGLPIELVPLTRPYGLEPGFAFTARAYLDGEPLPDAMVEIEKFNGFHVAEEGVPKDQFGLENVPMVTRTAKTDANGYVTCTLDEPGWWMVAVSAEGSAVTVGDVQYSCELRGCLWVHVEEEFTAAK